MKRSVVLALALATLASGCPSDPATDAGPGVDVGPLDAPIPPGVDANLPCVPRVEICGDRIDQDCNGRDTSCGDTDRDGIDACRPGEAPPACDCDDSNAGVYPPFGTGTPGGAELCDGLDNDCNGRIDEASQCCDGCAFLGAERDRADVCTEAGGCDCSTEPGDGPCPSGETCCLAGCVNTDTDFANCGLCGAMCTNQADHCELGPSGLGECRCGAGMVCDFIYVCMAGACGM